MKNSDLGTRIMREPLARSSASPPLNATSLGLPSTGQGTSAAPTVLLAWLIGGAAINTAQLSVAPKDSRSPKLRRVHRSVTARRPAFFQRHRGWARQPRHRRAARAVRPHHADPDSVSVSA